MSADNTLRLGNGTLELAIKDSKSMWYDSQGHAGNLDWFLTNSRWTPKIICEYIQLDTPMIKRLKVSTLYLLGFVIARGPMSGDTESGRFACPGECSYRTVQVPGRRYKRGVFTSRYNSA